MATLTLSDVTQRFASRVLQTRHLLPRTANKGLVGLTLEDLLGIPHSSKCLDCSDGEVKATEFVFKKGTTTNAAHTLQPKETVAVTMVDKAALLTTPFRNSRVYEKLRNVLFVVYVREPDGTVLFHSHTRFGEDHPLFAALETDYETIRSEAAKGRYCSRIGVYMQTRTKGPGHGSTSRGFYLKKELLKTLFP